MKLLLMLMCTCSIFLYSCGTGTGDTENDSGNIDTMDEEADMVAEADSEDMNQATAMASLSAKSGSNVSGSITFEQTGDSIVTMQIDVSGLTPGTHAIHLHETGDCSAEDASSAGGHWNPSGEAHGKRSESEEFHAGDIINLEVGTDSTYSNTIEVQGWTIGTEEMSNIVGRAVVIHAQADDFTSQPSGAAGGRVACGVIEEQQQM
jgi:superoxide dismutase, Cu-Zn family